MGRTNRLIGLEECSQTIEPYLGPAAGIVNYGGKSRDDEPTPKTTQALCIAPRGKGVRE